MLENMLGTDKCFGKRSSWCCRRFTTALCVRMGSRVSGIFSGVVATVCCVIGRSARWNHGCGWIPLVFSITHICSQVVIDWLQLRHDVIVIHEGPVSRVLAVDIRGYRLGEVLQLNGARISMNLIVVI